MEDRRFRALIASQKHLIVTHTSLHAVFSQERTSLPLMWPFHPSIRKLRRYDSSITISIGRILRKHKRKEETQAPLSLSLVTFLFFLFVCKWFNLLFLSLFASLSSPPPPPLSLSLFKYIIHLPLLILF